MTTDPAANLIGAVRRSPNGTRLAILWPSPPHPARWMVTDRWGSTGYETDEVVADWPVVGAVPYSPAAGMELAEPAPQQEHKRFRITDEHLANVAAVYAKARGKGWGPTLAVANHFAVPHSTAARWVGHARKRDLLPATTVGRSAS